MWLIIYPGDPPTRISVNPSRLGVITSWAYFGKPANEITLHDLLRYCFIRSHGLMQARDLLFTDSAGSSLRVLDYEMPLRFYGSEGTFYVYRRDKVPHNLWVAFPLRVTLLDRVWDAYYRFTSRNLGLSLKSLVVFLWFYAVFTFLVVSQSNRQHK
ncbi:hypothetical protein ANRL3_00530 [Anaerolineae bacterium]|nr:hypothetical protein ANRL3_00530 [Anaerolineae bacterium]